MSGAAASVEANVASVRARIADAARRSGRDPAEVTLVAATKTVPVEVLAALVAAGVDDLGENRAQELLAKASVLADESVRPRWHFIGALQRNKVRALAPWVDLWQSVDRELVGIAVARQAPGAHALVEVNLGDEPTKAGCARGEVPRLVDVLRELGLSVDGLMTVPPAGSDPRRWFASLADLAARVEVPDLSMGMSEDFEVAVEEGATIVRVGRALFGPRAV
ncbi:MAG: YggS family pyridoxal phosphate-dependent enzyme [Acidimicrobiia bacterium]